MAKTYNIHTQIYNKHNSQAQRSESQDRVASRWQALTSSKQRFLSVTWRHQIYWLIIGLRSIYGKVI